MNGSAALARRMIDAGADVVVGGIRTSPRAESYKGRLIVYSLGNFVFDEYEDRTGWVLRLTLNKDGLVEWDTVVARTDATGDPASGPGGDQPAGEGPGSEAIPDSP